METTPLITKGSKEGYISQDYYELTTVRGHWIPEGVTHKGKKVTSGVFVYTTGKDEEEKKRAFALARKEIGKPAKTLHFYEVMEV